MLAERTRSPLRDPRCRYTSLFSPRNASDSIVSKFGIDVTLSLLSLPLDRKAPFDMRNVSSDPDR